MSLSSSPIISVIMPSLNVVDYISECMESVVAQTMQDIEIICVDGGSTDGTIDIIEEYALKDRRIKIIHSEIKSYGYQMNLGVAAARGKYIGIVETDDYIGRDMYEKLYSYIKDSNEDFVKGGYISFLDINGKRAYSQCLNLKCKPIYGEHIDLKMNREVGLYDPVHIWSGIYRKDFLISKGIWFHESLGASYQDTSFSVLVGIMADSCIYVDLCTYYYRRDNDNSSAKAVDKLDCLKSEYKYVNDYLEKNGEVPEKIRLLVDRYKLVSYMWDIRRVSEVNRDRYIKIIAEEMTEFLPGRKFAEALNDTEREYVRVLTEPEYADFFMRKEEEPAKVYKELLLQIASGTKFIVMGAGKYFDKLIYIKNYVNKNFIMGVCDNNVTIQGTERHGYSIMSVEDAIQKYQREQWLVVNKHHSSEMVSQLQEAGIMLEKMHIVDHIIGDYQLLQLIRKYCTGN